MTHSFNQGTDMRSATSVLPAGHRRGVLAVVLALALALGSLVSVTPEPAHAATCPCTLFTAAQTPANASEDDSSAVELGVKFRADQAGFIAGIRFYKGTGNGGTHTGSLWSSTGGRLATVTFTGETATGWQQATFASPVAVTANTTYVASYYAPTGHYAADDHSFDNAVVNSPLTALKNGTEGGNGVYRYGGGGGFPSSTYNSSNYWVDVVFTSSGSDTTAPTVTDRQPADGTTAVPVSAAPSATFSEAVQPATIALSVTPNGGSAVAATTAYDAGSRTATVTPSASLATSTTYTVSLSGAKDAAGNQMTPVSWTFTTAATATGACPCTIWPNTTTPATAATADSSAVEVGVKLRTSQAGYISGIRFYKGTGNSGTHVGSLWTGTGTNLASVTFTGETATGWQQANFGAPVPVNANTTYVASYYAPVGRYANSGSYFASAATVRGPLTALRNGTDGGDGVYRYGASGFPNSSYQSTNYWVDVVFDTTATDNTAPTVTARTPAPGSSGAATSSKVTATFSEPVSSVVMALNRADGSGGPVTSTTGYDAGTRTATLTPSQPLDPSTAYTATVSGAKDAAGNTMTPVNWSFTTTVPAPPPPDQGPGGPIAVVTSSSNRYSSYLAEILRTEGLNEFATIDVGALSPSVLAAYDVVVLGAVPVTAGQASDLTTWVNGGGNLIAMRPSATLSGLLGITAASGTVDNGYLSVDANTGPGAGIVSGTIQFHGPADRYTRSGADLIATLYSTATAATANPAVTLRNVGSNGGQAAAFTFDLPASIVATRQGNIAWAGTERDGQAGPIRSDDMFFGGSTATDWVNLAKVAIPQADEQQRLLTNLIQVMNRDRKPLPRFWYFPRQLKAVVVGTGDDHGNGGTAGRFDQYEANSPANCVVSDWKCYRFSSYIYPGTPLSDSAASGYTNRGFEVGVHPSTNCQNYTPASIADVYTTQLASWKSSLPSVPSPVTNRTHCIAFSDWISQPKVELANGIRMDTNYYYWPASWVQNRPGFMTGSGMPMRFADTDGSMVDIYQAATQMTDESGQTYPFTADTLLDNALGDLGYYGAFTANMHTDAATTADSNGVLASAKARGVPIVSGKQMLDWIDGRNRSTYGSIAWSANTLSFTVGVGTGANGLTGMLPTAGPNGTQLTGITRGGNAVTLTTSTVKGLEYASFTAAVGSYSATYGGGAAPLTVSAPTARSAPDTTESDAASPDTPSTDTAATEQAATIAWQTNKVSSSAVLLGTTPATLSLTKAVGEATRAHAVRVKGLKPGTKYYYRVVSTDTSGQVLTTPGLTAAPATFTTDVLDRVAPKAAAPRITALPGGTALVRWTTDEPTAAVVRVGTDSPKLVQRTRTKALTREHSMVVHDLAPGTTYSYDVVSLDAVGNRTVSKTASFVTPASGVAQHSAPSFLVGTSSGAATVDESDLGRVTLGGGTKEARTGRYVSGVLDARAMVDWDRAVWNADLPTGSRAVLSVRTGSTADPDRTWSAWSAVPAKGRITGSSRFIQYRVDLSSSAGEAAPSLYAIGFSNNGAAPEDELEGEN